MIRIMVTVTVLLLSGCMTAAEHRDAIQNDAADRVTIGTVQREIRIGMSSADVASVLGSPNIVSTDEKRREVWIYDKVATTTTHSAGSSGISILILGAKSNAGAMSTSQKTLTIIIKFNENGKVRDFSYRTSSF